MRICAGVQNWIKKKKKQAESLTERENVHMVNEDDRRKKKCSQETWMTCIPLRPFQRSWHSEPIGNCIMKSRGGRMRYTLLLDRRAVDDVDAKLNEQAPRTPATMGFSTFEREIVQVPQRLVSSNTLERFRTNDQTLACKMIFWFYRHGSFGCERYVKFEAQKNGSDSLKLAVPNQAIF